MTTTTKIVELEKALLAKMEEIATMLNDIGIDAELIDLDEIPDFDTIEQTLHNENAFDVEIVYYSNALSYLANNDPSLRESLSIASEYGFDVASLNSEILASLLATANKREEFNEIRFSLEELCNELRSIADELQEAVEAQEAEETEE